MSLVNNTFAGFQYSEENRREASDEELRDHHKDVVNTLHTSLSAVITEHRQNYRPR